MTDLEKALADLKSEIYDNALIQEYFRLREAVTNNEDLIKLKKEINNAQVQLSLSMADANAHANNKRIYEELIATYEQHPLINNFNILQKEVRTFLQNIVDLLE